MSDPVERLFFALWPDQALRKWLTETYASFTVLKGKGRVLPDYNLHMTLHFLGNVETDRIDCLVAQARKVKAKAKEFNIKLTRSGYFKRPRIVWIGTDCVCEPLRGLHRQLGEHLKPCGYNPEHRPYCPHFTLARKIMADPGELSFKPFTWQINRFVLVQSVPVTGGVRYRVKQSFELG